MPHNTLIDKSMEALAASVASIITADDNNVAKAAAMTKTFEQFGDYLKANVSDDVTGDHPGDTDKKLSGKLKEMVAALIASVPSLSEEHAMHFLLHSPHGRKLAEHLNSISKAKEHRMPQIDIMKVIAITEQGLLAQVTKCPGESYAKSFSRKYENDIDFRKQWRDLTDAKHLMALGKGMASLEPTSTEVGSTQVSDDSAEAVRLLSEMAEKQHRSFTQVFEDPANRALANRTYTRHHLPSSSTSGDELQGSGRDRVP
ncbi:MULTISPECIES: hypothetical protein [Bradyrhizobium]|uniref:Uncharacterized protein n=2 Tax=Bradyrhizobium TaxID=374 RepID=A0ABY0PYW3_9BRAD|nr:MULTISPECIES: hypothetical protein [Bradyrhizobium]SDJ17970.1 hypothetical protein SAMN05444163_4762 [Bradyrhizobium ottawaense]SEC84607.1 hypothetical protein SAMN05444171_2401 [Bradyrhizobium lablabi]